MAWYASKLSKVKGNLFDIVDHVRDCQDRTLAVRSRQSLTWFAMIREESAICHNR